MIKEDILNELNLEPLTTYQLANIMGKNRNSVRGQVSQMAKEGLLIKTEQGYILTDNGIEAIKKEKTMGIVEKPVMTNLKDEIEAELNAMCDLKVPAEINPKDKEIFILWVTKMAALCTKTGSNKAGVTGERLAKFLAQL